MAPAEDVVAGRLPEVLAESEKRAGDLAWQRGVARRSFRRGPGGSGAPRRSGWLVNCATTTSRTASSTTSSSPGRHCASHRGLVTQAAKNLVMDLEDADCRARFMIRDRDGSFRALFDTILTNAGIEAVLSGVRIPRMNSIMERWVQTCRHELLDRTLIWNLHHLLRALRGVRAVLQRASTASGHRQRPPTAPVAPTDHRSGADRPPRVFGKDHVPSVP